MLNGWPKKIKDELKNYKIKENELTIENECLMWGHRLVVPSSLRQKVLEELHSNHMGVVRMKAMARSYVWWSLHVWDWPDAPNERLHRDFLGPIEGQMYMVILDAHSKWVDIREMCNITAESTIEVFRDYFSTWGKRLF